MTDPTKYEAPEARRLTDAHDSCPNASETEVHRG